SFSLAFALIVALAGVWLCAVPRAVAQEPAATEPAASEPAQTETPLYEQDPYDLITMKKAKDEPPLKVAPLDLPGRRRPKYPRPNQILKIVLWDEPEKKYEVKWSAVEKIVLFEELVLAKAIGLVRAGNREVAYDYFLWLEKKDRELPGLREAVEDYLYREAGVQNQKGDYFGALAILYNLHDHNPKYDKLPNALGVTGEKLLADYDASGNYAGARSLLDNLRTRFPGHPTVAKWESDLQRRAGRRLEEARRAVDRGAFREADRAMQQVVLLWPDLPGAKSVLELLHRRYPRVIVGVNSPTADVDPRHRQDWAARRGSRLVYRTLTEFFGPGSEGGDYRCPLGQIEIEPLANRIVIQVRPGLRWAQGDATLGGTDVARQLLAMAEPSSDQYRPAWNELFAGVAVREVYRVEVEMRRPHVRPDALLQTAPRPYSAAGVAPPSAPPNGPYLIDQRGDEETIYVANSRYFAAAPSQPREVVEWRVAGDRQSQAQAIRLLRDGQIQVIDRLCPWTLGEFRSLKDVVVEPYAAPLVHCLIPNRKRPLMKECVFRRAILYGIHRRAILTHLLGDNVVEGCAVISGPFPQGTSYDDPLGYAYDGNVEPYPYEPGLAVMLATYVAETTAAKEIEKAKQKKESEQSEDPAADKAATEKPAAQKAGKDDRRIIARLTLAHPAHEIARVACQKIKEQLQIVGIEITLRELPPGPVERMPEDVDLLYAELPMWEPVVDSPELLGAEGLTGDAGAYMSLVLRQLRRATDWQQVRPLLHQIHRIAHDDVAVLPLWQLVDHFAYHASLKGVGSRPVSLYENVESWELTTPEEKEK
ncbi:MAG TPA: ABC transporter substrate-binding protein, partial [Thermoguttaceae bacterium]|nr:ABC transporter substrate-binding protein [Thermoguttaceae bacterium]